MELREVNVGDKVLYRKRVGLVIAHEPGIDHDQMYVPDYYSVEMADGTVMKCLVGELEPASSILSYS